MEAANDDQISQKSECEKQKGRALLRIRYLKAIQNLLGKQVTMALFDGSVVTGSFTGYDISGLEYQIGDLTTPCGTYPTAVVRGCDVGVMSMAPAEEVQGAHSASRASLDSL